MKRKRESQTKVDQVQSKDFAASAFKVTMSRVQQLALEKAHGPVPCPEQQLALLNSKKEKRDRTTLLCINVYNLQWRAGPLLKFSTNWTPKTPNN